MASTASHEEVSNFLGALIFFSYLVAALSLTSLITYDLFNLYNARKDAARQQHDHKSTTSTTKSGNGSATVSPLRLGLSVLFAILSFAVLSYHMLFFLIDSYTNYCRAHSLLYPVTPVEAVGSILSPTSASSPLYIWTWATHSTLFEDFAHSIVSQPACWWWTEKALLFSFAWNCFMAIEGKMHPQAFCLRG